MSSFLRILTALPVLLVGVESAAQSYASDSLLPSAEDRKFVSPFSDGQRNLLPPNDRFGTSLFSNSVDPSAVSEGSIFFGPGSPFSQPVSALGQITILFEPGVNMSSGEVQEFLSGLQLAEINRDERINMMVVSALDSSGVSLGFSNTLSEQPLNDGLSEIIDSLSESDLVVTAGRDPVLTTNVLADVVFASPPPPSPAASTEVVDWGINDARLPLVWPLLDDDPLRVGVIDVGFADHEDIDFVDGLPHQHPRHDHGNHVSGIICAKHNGLGTTGALPNCTVVRASGNFILNGFSPIEDSIDDEGVSGWSALFSEIVSTVLDFTDQNPEVNVVNLSMGYNWASNFGIDPLDPDHRELRNEVRALGRMWASVLAYALRQDVIVVSAAGNDHNGAPTAPPDATWASPFNFGARLIENINGWTNGIVVEAHDDQGDAAWFSNGNGHISGPGVDIHSALASGSDKYGVKSGTSMAAPYVAAVAQMLQSVHDQLTLEQRVNCLLSVSRTTNRGVPMLDANEANLACQ